MDQSAKSLAELLHIVATTTLHGGSDTHRRPLAAHVLLQAINEKVLVGSQDGETSLKEQLQSSTMAPWVNV